MGLDMYLTGERYLWSHSTEDREKAARIKEQFPELADPNIIKTISAEVGYWRKANAIHKWFVDHCQEGRDECQKTWVGKEQLEELLATVEKVLENNELAAELLPVQSGFFFGGKNYNEWYFEDLRLTRQICEDALALMNQPNWDIYYQSSW